ncbi:glycosyltransferase family 4 protein [Psychroflexus tropicus]|uniref:glycosyltransferase family 4 protein n=1 Tax=Psychroflexus tropicus TaxID=197345 RepID=UPI00037601C5|nr:glycosyltransferase family 4 protein [Psychroflexus tropicus]
MKKILFLTSELPPQPGGIGNHAHQLARYFSNHYEVTVIADQRSEDGKEEQEFDEQQDFSVSRVKRRRTLILTYLKRFFIARKLLKKNDILLVSGKFPLWVGGVLSLSSNKPIVVIIHGSEVQLSNALARHLTDWSLKRLDHIIAVSRFTLQLIESLNLEATTVIPNGFDLPKTKVESSYDRNNKAIPLQLITVGNLTQRKGQHNVINVLPQLSQVYPDLIYHCVGIPTEINRLEKLAKALKVEQHVKFHGRVTEEEKFELLNQADVFMMLSEQTSTGDVEGFGIAILEANAMGLPAVGSLNCGIEDAIEDQLSGRLVNPHDVDQLVLAIKDIMNNQSQYSAQAKVWSEHFTWDRIGKKYLEVLEEFE